MTFFLYSLLLSLASSQSLSNVVGGTERTGFSGPIHVVKIEEARLSSRDGRLIETPRVLSEVDTYDSSGHQVEKTAYKAGSLISRQTFAYNSKGLLVGESLYEADGSLAEELSYLYDQTGRMTGASHSEGKVVYGYDANGHRTEETFYVNGSVYERYTYSFDLGGRVTEWKQLKAGGEIAGRFTFGYDDKGRQISRSMYGSKGLYRKSQFVYDENGNNTEESSYSADGLLQARYIFTYEFDAKGNWTKRSTKKLDGFDKSSAESVDVIYRTLTYY